MASGEGDKANDSIDELLDGLPADPMLPRKRARSIEEVKAATPPISQNRRIDDKVVVSNDSDPRERAKREAEQSKRESSTFGTAFLQARATREKVIFGVVMMLAVLGIYAFARHAMHSGEPTPGATSPAQSVQITHILAASGAPPLSTDDVPAPPSPVEASHETAPATTARTKTAHSGEVHGPKPAPTTSASGTRTDVSRSL